MSFFRTNKGCSYDDKERRYGDKGRRYDDKERRFAHP